MSTFPEGNAIVYCEGAFNTTNGKTAHGLVRFTKRYKVLSVVDSNYVGQDAGTVLDSKQNGIMIFDSIETAIESAKQAGQPASYLVVGLAPDGGRLSFSARQDVMKAVRMGLNVDCGLHDFLSDDPEIMSLADKMKVCIRDIRKPLPRDRYHFFSGKIEQVTSLKIAALGTDSAIGKRTTAWIVVNALNRRGYKAELVGTGQTAWMQGVGYGMIMDTLVNDFVSGEIEHAVWAAWNEARPDALVIEGQGSLLNPAYPGGYEILAAGRPDIILLQHAPARKEYDGFPGYPIQPLTHQIEAITVVSGKPVAAVTLNHENMDPVDIPKTCQVIEAVTGVPAFDVLLHGADGLVDVIQKYIAKNKRNQSYKVDTYHEK